MVELLVVMSVISMLMAILLPVLGQVRRQARSLQNAGNQKQITAAVNLFAADHDDWYPQSVATVGFGDSWNWSDPTKLAGPRRRSPAVYRSMSAYLRTYLPDAETVTCPSAPGQYKYLQEAWLAGDEWDNPETPVSADPVGGTYCLYWNYRGFLGGRRGVFRGPAGPASGGRYSKLLITDYFGYGHWRSPGAFGSCERFEGATVAAETWLLAAYWSGEGDLGDVAPKIKLRAGFTDGHVESYATDEVIPMKVSITADGTVPYPDDVGPGIFFLPRSALH